MGVDDSHFRHIAICACADSHIKTITSTLTRALGSRQSDRTANYDETSHESGEVRGPPRLARGPGAPGPDASRRGGRVNESSDRTRVAPGQHNHKNAHDTLGGIGTPSPTGRLPPSLYLACRPLPSGTAPLHPMPIRDAAIHTHAPVFAARIHPFCTPFAATAAAHNHALRAMPSSETTPITMCTSAPSSNAPTHALTAASPIASTK